MFALERKNRSALSSVYDTISGGHQQVAKTKAMQIIADNEAEEFQRNFAVVLSLRMRSIPLVDSDSDYISDST